jgi:hypothetical protein
VNEIIEALDVKSTEVFKTSRIMQALGALGRQRGYRVSCHKTDYPEAEDGEWLYDMIWWQGNEDNYVLRNVMVLESEVGRNAKQRDDLDGDLPKLVQARADIRVWISTSPNTHASTLTIARSRSACLLEECQATTMFLPSTTTRRGSDTSNTLWCRTKAEGTRLRAMATIEQPSSRFASIILR